MMKNPTIDDKYAEIGLGSLPRTNKGRIDEREIYVLCGKARIPIDYIYELYPHEFIFYIEGYLENEREYFEYFNYSMFSSIRQALSDKVKKFENPFAKRKSTEEQQQKLTEEEYESEVNSIKKLFNL